MQLSKNFTRAEFACQDGCGFDLADPVLVYALQRLRDRIGQPIQVLSGCRCVARNKAVGGAANSQHLHGKAADIHVARVTARELYRLAVEVPQFRGFGVSDEAEFLHVDVRLLTARWCYKGGKQVAWFE